jgi:hypothetical protein
MKELRNPRSFSIKRDVRLGSLVRGDAWLNAVRRMSWVSSGRIAAIAFSEKASRMKSSDRFSRFFDVYSTITPSGSRR